MSDRSPEQLPDDVSALVNLERQSATAPPGARARVAARLGLGSIPSGPPSAAGAGGWGSPVVSLTAALIVAAAGAGVWLALRSPADVALPARPESAAPAIAAPTIPPAPPRSVPPPVPPPAPSPSTRLRALATPDTEVALLAAARKALTAGDASSALALVRRHERNWPRGELVQEREVMAVQALAASGAGAKARARADHFLRRFPGSTLAETVRRLRDDASVR